MNLSKFDIFIPNFQWKRNNSDFKGVQLTSLNLFHITTEEGRPLRLQGFADWSWPLLFPQQTYAPAHDKTYNKTCVTSKDLHPPSMARFLVHYSLASPWPVHKAHAKRKDWSDCTNVQADPSLCCSHKSYCRFSCLLAHNILINPCPAE